MSTRVILISLAFVLLSTSSFGNFSDPAANAAGWYYQANKLFGLNAPTARTDSLAFLYFNNAIKIIENSPLHTSDVLLFQSYVKKGNLLDIKKQYVKATETYRKALIFQKGCKNLCDSLAFAVEVFAAASYYNLNNLDSANILLLSAEALIDRFPRLPDKERMYNAMGALYFEKGNYHQSNNYFRKALETIRGRGGAYRIMQINFETNIASSLFKLDLYNESLSIYKDIIRLKGFPNYTYFNMGKVYSAKCDYGKALASFRKVTIQENPGVLNEIGYAHLQLSNVDSAAYYLDKFEWFNQGNKLNVLDNGINKMYWAEFFVRQKKFHEALKSLQHAVVFFSGNFDIIDIYKNPLDFTGTFNPYNLYNALNKKAVVLNYLYCAVPDEKYLILSLQTYQTALQLLQYIEKSYDTDDSKIFLKKKKQDIYDKALEIALELHKKHPDKDYLEQAFLITEKNKASIIAASLIEKGIKDLPEKDKKLLEEETNIKYQIAKVKISTGNTGKVASVQSLSHAKMDYEIALSRVQKKLEQNHFYYHLKYDDSYPSVAGIQSRLQKDQALISFQSSENVLHVFLLTQTNFRYFTIDSFTLLRQHIENWLDQLKTNISGRKFNGENSGNFIYRRLVSPIQKLVSDKNEWIIIPDGIICYLPFESLPSGKKDKFLLETVEISYQLSSRFIVERHLRNNDNSTNNILAFAPFASRPRSANAAPESFSFSQLPDSYNEIKNLQGKLYLDDQATKKQFLKEISNYSIIHLATHAVSDRLNSAESFIAFYPSTGNRDQNCLFLEELYSINMDNTKLVIISACETGNGEWVSNEGIISIARGFSYAGCASTINSLWKADDKATSFILQQFHMYLKKGYTKSRALQLAKIDYIKSDAIYKTPNYWAHLVLTGNNQPLYRIHFNLTIYILAGVLLFITIIVYKKKTRLGGLFQYST